MPIYHKQNPDGSTQLVMSMLPMKQLEPGFVQTDDPKEISLLVRGLHRCVLRGGRVVDKPSVKIVADRRGFRADGVELVKIKVEDLPAEFDRCTVRVGDQAFTLLRGEELEVSSRVAGVVQVKVDEPGLYAEPLLLQAMADEPPR